MPVADMAANGGQDQADASKATPQTPAADQAANVGPQGADAGQKRPMPEADTAADTEEEHIADTTTMADRLTVVGSREPT